jgi:hypothetical protein
MSRQCDVVPATNLMMEETFHEVWPYLIKSNSKFASFEIIYSHYLRMVRSRFALRDH